MFATAQANRCLTVNDVNKGSPLPDSQGPADFFWYDDSSQVVHPANDARCFHIFPLLALLSSGAKARPVMLCNNRARPTSSLRAGSLRNRGIPMPAPPMTCYSVGKLPNPEIRLWLYFLRAEIRTLHSSGFLRSGRFHGSVTPGRSRRWGRACAGSACPESTGEPLRRWGSAAR